MGRLDGKLAFVTGAARGQGRNHAVELARAGADIIAIDICGQIDTVQYPMAVPDDLAETVRQVEGEGRQIVAGAVDARDLPALREFLARAVTQLGRLDVVCVNHGICTYYAAADMPQEAWVDMIDTNLSGAWYSVQAALPHINDGASVILISSSAGLKGMSNIVHYVAAKHGVVGIMRGLAYELAPRGIRVNSIHPCSVDTPMVDNDVTYRLFRPDLESPTREDMLQAATTLNLLPVPQIESSDVSAAVMFLATDESRYITGVTLPVDAGYLAK